MLQKKLEQAWGAFQEAFRDPRQAQESFLRRTLARHAETEYGRKYDFKSISTWKEYQERVPVIRYSDVAHYLDRMLAGEPNVLIAGQPVFFATTSGTTGKPKHLGYHQAVVDEEYMHVVGPTICSMERDHPGVTQVVCHIAAQYNEARSDAGAVIGQTTGFVRRNFYEHPIYNLLPELVYDSKDYDARYYAILRLALAAPLRLFMTLYPSILLNLFARCTEFADALIHDLEAGTLEAGPGNLEPLAAACRDRLKADPAAAKRLRENIRSNGYFAPEEYWSDLRVLQVWKGGSAKQYIPQLRKICPTATIRPFTSGASETSLMIAMDDSWDGGVPALLSTGYEFFPAGTEPTVDGMVPLLELEEGTGYQMVVTNNRSLYRYRMDDVFYVEGWERGVPVIRFSHRIGVTCSVAGEKMTEAIVIEAMATTVGAVPVDLVGYEVGPVMGDRPSYCLVVEVSQEVTKDLLWKFLEAFESSLCQHNIAYRQYRDSGLLNPPQLYLLPEGAFAAQLRKRASASGRSDAQMKLHPLQTKTDALEVADATLHISL